MTNILKGIANVIKNNLYSIEKYKELNYKIRINNTGEALENLVKDILCGTFDEANRIEAYNKYFSYLGNQNNPPDLIIKKGDAFEIKKIESKEGAIALNSSFPKDKLYRNSNMITNACRNCEDDWEEKDICYVVGSIDSKKVINSLWFVYGDCYCAKPEVYEKTKEKIILSITKNVFEFTETNEIAKIKKVDPLGITDLRVRGMWGIKHPAKVFEYTTKSSQKPHLRALMLKSKFDSFDIKSRELIFKLANVKNIKIQNPNNPANTLDAVLIEHEQKT